MTSSCVACAIETFSDNIFSRRSIIIPFKACKVKLARTIISYWFLPVRVLWYYASHSNREFVFYHLSKNHVQYFYSRILWSKRDLSYIYTPLTFQQHAWFWFCTRNWRLVQLAELIQKSESEISGYQRPRTRPGRLSGSGEAEYADEGPSRETETKIRYSYFLEKWLHGWWTPFRRDGVRNDLCDWFASIYVTGSQWWKGWDQSSTEKLSKFVIWLAHVCYHISLKYHRALSDFQAGCGHQETTNCDIRS